MHPQPVVAGVDGSAESLAAAAWAAREARRREVPLRLVHAWSRSPRQADREVLNVAGQLLAGTDPELEVTDEQVAGAPVTALVAAAERAEVLVLGSRGRSGFTGFLVGSTAQGVVARATRPVVLVRAGEEPADERLPDPSGRPSVTTGYRDVVLGVDLDEPCDEVIAFAFDAARLRAAPLHVVHARQQAADQEERHGFLAAVLEPWRGKYPEVPVRETLLRGRPTTALPTAATGAGLLVVGRHISPRPLPPHTGRTTHAAIHHTTCPLAVVPHS